MLEAELAFRARLKLPKSTANSEICAVTLIIRAPLLLKNFGDVHNLIPQPASFKDHTRAACYDTIIKLLEDHNVTLFAAATTTYSAVDASTRVNIADMRAPLLLSWALRYDVATGPHVIFKDVSLVDRYCAERNDNRKSTIWCCAFSHCCSCVCALQRRW